MRQQIIDKIGEYITFNCEGGERVKNKLADELTQMMCDKVYVLLSAKYSVIYNPEKFVKLILPNVMAESIASGFTEQQIIYSLNKIKNS